MDGDDAEGAEYAGDEWAGDGDVSDDAASMLTELERTPVPMSLTVRLRAEACKLTLPRPALPLRGDGDEMNASATPAADDAAAEDVEKACRIVPAPAPPAAEAAR